MTQNYLGGYVTSPRDFIGKTRKIDEDGLFSEKIFGPVHSYRCACGKYTKTLHMNEVCPNCHVLCASNELRSITFAKIPLIFPIVKLSKREKFLKIVGSRNKKIINPTRADYLSSTTNYIAMKTDKSKIQIVHSLIPKSGFLVIPFRITGIYSLHLVLRFLKEYLNVPSAQEIFDKKYLVNDIKVLPPNLRLITYDAVKREIRTPNINKYYTAILRLNKRNIVFSPNLALDEEDWLSQIVVNLKARIFDQDIVIPTVMEYDMYTAKYQYYADLVYRSVYDELSG